MSDRELMLDLKADLASLVQRETERNGILAELVVDYYGSADRRIVGSKSMTEANTLAIDRGRTAGKTIAWLLGLVGISNAVGLLALIARLS